MRRIAFVLCLVAGVVFVGAPGRVGAQPAGGLHLGAANPNGLQGLHPPLYQLSVRSALVKPGKADGHTWDLGGMLTPEATKGLESLGQKAGALLLANRAGQSLAEAALGAGLPWLANFAVSAKGAPDVSITVRFRGEPVMTTPPVDDTINPTWTGADTSVLPIGPRDEVMLVASDLDLGNSYEPIGQCSFIGPPRVDEQGYVLAESLHCEGSLVGVSLRAVQVGGTEAPPPVVAYPAPVRIVQVPATLRGLSPGAAPSPEATGLLRTAPLQAIPQAAPAARPTLSPTSPIISAFARLDHSMPPRSVRVSDVHLATVKLGTYADIILFLEAACHQIVAVPARPGARISLELFPTGEGSRTPAAALGFDYSAQPVLGGERRLCVETRGFYRVSVGTLDDATDVGVVAYRLPPSSLLRGLQMRP